MQQAATGHEAGHERRGMNSCQRACRLRARTAAPTRTSAELGELGGLDREPARRASQFWLPLTLMPSGDEHEQLQQRRDAPSDRAARGASSTRTGEPRRRRRSATAPIDREHGLAEEDRVGRVRRAAATRSLEADSTMIRPKTTSSDGRAEQQVVGGHRRLEARRATGPRRPRLGVRPSPRGRGAGRGAHVPTALRSASAARTASREGVAARAVVGEHVHRGGRRGEQHDVARAARARGLAARPRSMAPVSVSRRRRRRGHPARVAPAPRRSAARSAPDQHDAAQPVGGACRPGRRRRRP